MLALDGTIIVGAIIVAIPATISAVAAFKASQGVKTLNQKTIGILAGEDETRRIMKKPAEERTPSDQQHLLDIPPEKENGT